MKRFFLVLGVSILISGCNEQGRGFNLPPGDAEQGRMTFILMQCNDCHSVVSADGTIDGNGVAWAGEEGDSSIHVKLGGTTTQVRTYGDLVTSVINPSHKLSRGSSTGTVDGSGESAMRKYNDVMTVQELVDLVTYLQSRYEIWVPDYYSYGI